MLIDKHLKYSIEDVNDEREEQDDPLAMRQTASAAIEKSLSDDDLEFEYYVGPWSSCTQTCGLNDSGYRVSRNSLKEEKKYRFLCDLLAAAHISFALSRRLII